MPEIAIVEMQDCGGCYECSGHTFANSITRWETVSDKELAALKKYYRSTNRGTTCWVIERVPTEEALKSVKNAVAAAQREAEKAEKRKKYLADEKLRKEKEKAEKALEKEREVFEKLRSKFEGSV